MPIGFAPRLAALYAAIFAVMGIQLPFFPLWLEAKGLDASMIGVVLAAPLVVRIFAITVATRVADRRDVLRGAIAVTAAASIAGFALVGLASGPFGILAAYTVAAFAFTPVMPLTEAYALKGLAARGRAYGPVRLWGSAAFILGTFAAGFATDLFPTRHLIWLIAGMTLIAALAALALTPLPSVARAGDEPAPSARGLLGNRGFLAVVAAASLIQASHAVYYAFSALEWRSAGIGGGAIAGLWALGVIAEIGLFASQGRLPPAITPAVLLMIGGCGAALRWAAMACAPPVALLPFLQLLHAASFGATHLGALAYVARVARAGQAATAQGVLAIALGLTMAVATGLSGLIYGSVGSLAYAAMALAAVAGGVAGYIAKRAARAAG